MFIVFSFIFVIYRMQKALRALICFFQSRFALFLLLNAELISIREKIWDQFCLQTGAIEYCICFKKRVVSKQIVVLRRGAVSNEICIIKKVDNVTKRGTREHWQNIEGSMSLFSGNWNKTLQVRGRKHGKLIY